MAKALAKREDKWKKSVSCSLEHEIQQGTSHEQCKPAQFRQGNMVAIQLQRIVKVLYVHTAMKYRKNIETSLLKANIELKISYFTYCLAIYNGKPSVRGT